MANFQVYLIKHKLDYRVYVGFTSQGVENRWAQHCEAAKQGSDYHLHLAISKYGKEQFEYETLCEISSRQEAKYIERLWIAAFGSYRPEFGFNMTYGGEGGELLGQEARNRLSTALKGNKNKLGWVTPDSVKKKQSASAFRDIAINLNRGMLGKKQSKKHAVAMLAKRGRKRNAAVYDTAEYKRIISESVRKSWTKRRIKYPESNGYRTCSRLAT